MEKALSFLSRDSRRWDRCRYALNYHTHLITFPCDFPGGGVSARSDFLGRLGSACWKWLVFRNPMAHMTLSCPGWQEFHRIPSSPSYFHYISSTKENIRLLITFQSWQVLRWKSKSRKVRERSNPWGV